MRQRDKQAPQSAEETVRDIRRATRRHFSAEEKIRIVLEGLRGEDSIAELCRKEGIAQNLYYRWSKEFLEAGKKRLAGDTAREATSDEVKTLRAEARQLKEALLVSHWSVYSDATVKLITSAIDTMAADKSLGRAEGMRRSMLALIDKGEPSEAHPSFWAPFVVVGEGGTTR
jgi:transposase